MSAAATGICGAGASGMAAMSAGSVGRCPARMQTDVARAEMTITPPVRANRPARKGPRKLNCAPMLRPPGLPQRPIRFDTFPQRVGCLPCGSNSNPTGSGCNPASESGILIVYTLGRDFVEEGHPENIFPAEQECNRRGSFAVETQGLVTIGAHKRSPRLTRRIPRSRLKTGLGMSPTAHGNCEDKEP